MRKKCQQTRHHQAGLSTLLGLDQSCRCNWSLVSYETCMMMAGHWSVFQKSAVNSSFPAQPKLLIRNCSTPACFSILSQKRMIYDSKKLQGGTKWGGVFRSFRWGKVIRLHMCRHEPISVASLLINTFYKKTNLRSAQKSRPVSAI